MALWANLLGFCSDRYRNVYVIIVCHVVAMFLKAFQTAVHNAKFPSSSLDTYRLHEAATLFRPITRLNINMLAPQTLWAMIGVPGTFYFCLALLTDEILGPPLESHTKIREEPSRAHPLHIQEHHCQCRRFCSHFLYEQ
jgi:hypothetical protein